MKKKRNTRLYINAYRNPSASNIHKSLYRLVLQQEADRKRKQGAARNGRLSQITR